MTIQRAAVIFDDTLRPETTGTYCLRALRHFVSAEHLHPANLPRARCGDFDLFVNIDDGQSYSLPCQLRPAVFWAIDTHLDYERCLTRSRSVDFVFCAQRDGAERLEADGIAAEWLPLACDPEIHRQYDVPKKYDITFIGNVFPGERAELLALLCREFPHHYVGQSYFDDMARAYSASRTVFNRSVRNDINMRVFESLACGSLLLTNDLSGNGQAELLRDGIHLATYCEANELLDKVRYYLRRHDLRARIEAAGRAEALAKHTYRHRMDRLLNRAGQLASVKSDVRHRYSSGSWPQDQEATAASVESELRGPAQGLNKSSPYFEFARPELVALVPATARRVLDVGCAAGRLGEALKARQSVEVVGVELDAKAAAAARNRIDRIVVGSIEDSTVTFPSGSFDCIICGDVLEHLRDPASALERIRGWLSDDGVLVASIPNTRHHSVVGALLAGNWTYEPAGLLDSTHLCFFTRQDIVDLLAQTGFCRVRLKPIYGPDYADWVQAGHSNGVTIGGLHLSGIPKADAEEFFVYQYLVEATPGPESPLSTCPVAD